MAVRLKPIKDQVIVVTGATSGAGLATVRTAARRGARTMLIAKDETELGTIVRDINNAGGQADYAVADVAHAGALAAAARATVARFGRIDTWVNDPGVAIAASVRDAPDEEQQRQFQANYFGVVNGCLAAVPTLRDRGGALITAAAIAADLPGAAIGAYVEALRVELANQAPRISVTLVKPAIGEQAPDQAAHDQLVADAILDGAEHSRREVVVGGTGRAQRLFAAAKRPSIAAVLGIGGLALAAGAVAAVRRRRSS